MPTIITNIQLIATAVLLISFGVVYVTKPEKWKKDLKQEIKKNIWNRSK
jgi:uncharacterized protein YjeT (DUF2065 family)